jgi:hypothetical protein
MKVFVVAEEAPPAVGAVSQRLRKQSAILTLQFDQLLREALAFFHAAAA